MGLKTLSKLFAGLGDFYNQPNIETGGLNYNFTGDDVDLSLNANDPGLSGGDKGNSYDLSQENLDLTIAGNTEYDYSGDDARDIAYGNALGSGFEGDPSGGDSQDFTGGDGGSILSEPGAAKKTARGQKQNPRRRLDDLLADVSTRNRNRSILHPLGLPGNQPKGKSILGG